VEFARYSLRASRSLCTVHFSPLVSHHFSTPHGGSIGDRVMSSAARRRCGGVAASGAQTVMDRPCVYLGEV